MMTTPQGKVMSPRAERVYRFLNNRGIMLTTFSTDMCVRGYFPRIESALQALQDGSDSDSERRAMREISGAGDRTFTEQEREQTIADVQAIMRRVPENRSAAARR